MKNPLHSRPRVAASTIRRVENLRMLIDALRIRNMDVREICLMLDVGDSAARKYILDGMYHNAIEIHTPADLVNKKAAVYRIANDLAASPMSDKFTAPESIPKRRKSIAELRVAQLAKEGRRLIRRGDDGDYVKPEPMRPAFRCAFETLFFGPAKVSA